MGAFYLVPLSTIWVPTSSTALRADTPVRRGYVSGPLLLPRVYPMLHLPSSTSLLPETEALVQVDDGTFPGTT